MTEWLEVLTCYPETPGSILLSEHQLDLFTVVQCANPQLHL